MTRLRKKGFTLIELIEVLVIMAILALIVIPLIMNIIMHARISADKRSIDAYGRSIELAIASYLLDTGKFPTEVSQLTIEYSGDTVTCTTEQINPDSSVYLADCKVKNRNVEGYTYGTDKSPTYTSYAVGDEVTYNGVDYYVIKNSGINESTVTMLKSEPLTVDEVNQYGGVGTANNYVNMYVTKDTSASYYQTAYNQNGYGGMAFYSSETCGYEIGGTLWPNDSECTSNYKDSNVKNVVDAWALDKIPSGLQEARLITKDEYISYCLEEEYQSTPSDISTRFVPQYNWIYNNNCTYWTMTSYEDSDSDVWIVVEDGGISSLDIFEDGGYTRTVRPVIVLDKSVLN